MKSNDQRAMEHRLDLIRRSVIALVKLGIPFDKAWDTVIHLIGED